MKVCGATAVWGSHTLYPSLHLPPSLSVSSFSPISTSISLSFSLLHCSLLFTCYPSLYPFHFTRPGKLPGSRFGVPLIKTPRYILNIGSSLFIVLFKSDLVKVQRHVKGVLHIVFVGIKIIIVSQTVLVFFFFFCGNNQINSCIVLNESMFHYVFHWLHFHGMPPVVGLIHNNLYDLQLSTLQQL